MSDARISSKALQILVDEALGVLWCNGGSPGTDELFPMREAVKAAQDALESIVPKVEHVPVHDFDVEYHEYECGRPCTQDGCPGHTTDMPIGFTFSGATFYVAGAEGGDFPSHDNTINKAVQEAFLHLEQRLDDTAIAQLEAEHERYVKALEATVGRLKKIVLYRETAEVRKALLLWGTAGTVIDWLDPPPLVDEILGGLK